jgi:dTDP-4-dehydrorhamnose reductase
LAVICGERHIPIIHLSTDYVYNGGKKIPYVETDPTSPLGMYGHSKLEGERAVIAANPRHIILRTAWVYSPFGNNFVKTMLRLAENRDEISVVNDQVGNPTYAPHLAMAILKLVPQIMELEQTSEMWGIYHASAMGEASWYDFACEIFRKSAQYGGPAAKVQPIGTKDYPTPVRRPVNSRLDCSKLNETFGIHLPDWHEGTADCVERLLQEDLS